MSIRLWIVDGVRKTDALGIYKRELAWSQFWTKRKLESIQKERLSALLDHAYRNVPYYKRVFDERGLKPKDIQSLPDLRKLPVLRKEDIRRYFKELRALNAKIYSPRWLASGGSTGEPLRYLVDGGTNGYQWADVYRGQIIGGWKPGDKTGRFWGSSVLSIQKPVLKQVYSWLNNWCLFPAFDAGKDQMRRWIDIIRKDKIRFISGYVDTMVEFARFVIENDLQTHIVSAFPTTAPLTPSGRILLGKAFGSGVFNLYQSADGGVSAWECHLHDGLHISEERCVIESPEELGEHDISVVVTDLFNYAMPFIRYENGDEIRVTSQTCPCGRNSKIIKSVRGKTYHHLILPNGKRVHSEIFSYYLNNFLLVKRYCVRQTSPTEIKLEVALDNNFLNEMSNLRQSLSRLPVSLPGMNIKVDFVDDIEKLPNEKYKIFVPYEDNACN